MSASESKKAPSPPKATATAKKPPAAAAAAPPSPPIVPDIPPAAVSTKVDTEEGAAAFATKKPRSRRLPRAIREHMVGEIDRAVSIMLPLIQRAKRDNPTPLATPKEIGKQVIEILKTLRSSMRVRSAPRASSDFNLFVRETMLGMKESGKVFQNATERMKECGRLWKLRKAELAAAKH